MELAYPVKWIGAEPEKETVVDRIVSVEQHLGGTVVLASGLKFKNPHYQYCMFPVQFVRYDEHVYEELVRIGANNGVVETDNDKLGSL
eukprot:2420439-Prymnesium_polylepis.1